MASDHEKEEHKAAEALSRSSSEGLSEKQDGNNVSQAAEETTAAAEYPKGIPLFTIIAALLLNVFLVALDQTIVATAVSCSRRQCL
jgi:uncharacterized membrane protein